MKDRVPTYPGRVKLLPVPGQTNTFDMTMADEPIEAGTPPVKANLLKDATAALYGMGPKAVPDDIFAAIPGAIEPIGTVKVTVRKDLGENWALCNGDQYFPADVSQEFWDVASDPNVLYNGTLGTQNLRVEPDSNYAWTTASTYAEIRKIVSIDDTGWHWFLNSVSKHFELYFSNDFFRTFKKVSIDADTSNNPIVIRFKSSYYVWFDGSRYIWKLAGLDDPEAALTATRIAGCPILSQDFLGITDTAIYTKQWYPDDKLSYIYKIPDIEAEQYTKSETINSRNPYGLYVDETTGKVLIRGSYSSGNGKMFVAIFNENNLTISGGIDAADSSRALVGRSITKLSDGSFLLKDDTVGKRFTLTGSTLAYISGNSTYEFDIRAQTKTAIYPKLPEKNANGEYILVDKTVGLIFVKYDQASGTFVVSGINGNAIVKRSNSSTHILWNADKSQFVISTISDITTKPSIEMQPTNKLPAIDLDKVYAYIRIK